MNNDLISRSALKKAIKSYADDQYAENEYLGECAIMAIIDNAPTVEEVSIMNNDEAYKHIENIVFKYEEKELSSLEDRKLNNVALNHIREVLKNERPQGEWIRDEEHSITINMFKCSNCNGGGYTHFKYCPHCGALMGNKKC